MCLGDGNESCHVFTAGQNIVTNVTMESPADKEEDEHKCSICEESINKDKWKKSQGQQSCSHVICKQCEEELILRDPETQEPHHPCPLCAETTLSGKQ